MANYATSQSSSYVLERRSEMPPEWIWASGLRNAFIHPEGEIGVLENVRQSIVNPDRCLFITMIHHGNTYLGRLNLDQEEFCYQKFELLKANLAVVLPRSAQSIFLMGLIWFPISQSEIGSLANPYHLALVSSVN